ncbi:hypothetical protein F5883DRAFT_573509 [Diaporthe sp. PMI_573]|nr:hypothetical protein F5883DRAFT_573509 [Diaporthaceae sp. PMI_573]
MVLKNAILLWWSFIMQSYAKGRGGLILQSFQLPRASRTAEPRINQPLQRRFSRIDKWHPKPASKWYNKNEVASWFHDSEGLAHTFWVQ